jgi:hypothetical protein
MGYKIVRWHSTVRRWHPQHRRLACKLLSSSLSLTVHRISQETSRPAGFWPGMVGLGKWSTSREYYFWWMWVGKWQYIRDLVIQASPCVSSGARNVFLVLRPIMAIGMMACTPLHMYNHFHNYRLECLLILYFQRRAERRTKTVSISVATTSRQVFLVMIELWSN